MKNKKHTEKHITYSPHHTKTNTASQLDKILVPDVTSENVPPVLARKRKFAFGSCKILKCYRNACNIPQFLVTELSNLWKLPVVHHFFLAFFLL